MNNLLKSAARKHALTNGIATAKWGDDEFAQYVSENNITERDNLKKAATRTATATPPPVATPKGDVEAAIAALIASTQTAVELDENRVLELINQHSKAPTLTTVDVTRNEETVATIEGAHKMMPVVMAHIAAGVNLAAVGPAGSGKSTMFKQIAEALGLDYYTVGAVQQEHKILGYNDANGKYHSTPFRKAFENGGLIVIEEFDGSSAKAMLAANNATANDITDFPDGMVKRHPDFVCVMAGNTYGTGSSRQYVGRTQLDAATLDRFAFIEIGYDEAIELAAATAEFADAAHWVAEVQAFRAKVDKAGIRHVVSPRASIMGAKLLKQGLGLETIRQTCLHKGMSADQIAQVSK